MSVPDDSFPSLSSEEQHALETRVRDIYWEILEEDEDKREDSMRLFVDEHVRYLHKGFAQLPAGFVSLDASRPWICYWIVHSLALLGAPLPPGYTSAHVADFLKTCQHPKGGICGGQGQIPHLAPSYAGVMAALTVGGECLDALDRAGMASFLQRVMIPKAQGGGMHLHVGGEVDVRGCYTAAAVASTLGLVTPDLADSIEAYACACQTYEGGLGGEPWNEAHGGYTFCGLAALMLVGRAASLDLRRLAHWAVHRQGAMEGGFMGRTNKLVDGCYSFWQGGIFPLLERLGPELVGQMPVRPPPGPPPRSGRRATGPRLGCITRRRYRAGLSTAARLPRAGSGTSPGSPGTTTTRATPSAGSPPRSTGGAGGCSGPRPTPCKRPIRSSTSSRRD